MALQLSAYGGYGSGTNGLCTAITGQVNSYASIVDYDESSITIGTPDEGDYEKFEEGTQVLLHVSAGNGVSTSTTYLGRHTVATITDVDDTGENIVLDIDKDLTEIIPLTASTGYQIQAVTIAQFTTLSLEEGTISPIAYDTTNGYGGILAIKCSESLGMAGGTILLDGLGIPVASTAYRPVLTTETNGAADTAAYAGWENTTKARQFTLSCGCGALFLMTKALNITGAGYIGGNGGDAINKRGNRVGGASIFMVAGSVTGDIVPIIDCSYGSGAGLGGCYIASDTAVPGGYEAIFAADIISDKTRMKKTFNIKSFGDGSNGEITNPTASINNFAHVASMNVAGKMLSLEYATNSDSAPAFEADTLVMFHVSKPKGNTVDKMGKFKLAKIVSEGDGAVILDTSVADIVSNTEVLNDYDCQLITIPQASGVTISTDYTATTAWDNTAKRGGIFACACSGTFDLTGGKINVTSKGGGTTYATVATAVNGNAQCADKLPLGGGCGSVFIMAQTLVEDTNSRIGSTATGNALGGTGGTGGSGGSGGAGGTPVRKQFLPNSGNKALYYEGNYGSAGVAGGAGVAGSAGGAGYGGGGGGGNGGTGGTGGRGGAVPTNDSNWNGETGNPGGAGGRGGAGGAGGKGGIFASGGAGGKGGAGGNGGSTCAYWQAGAGGAGGVGGAGGAGSIKCNGGAGSVGNNGGAGVNSWFNGYATSAGGNGGPGSAGATANTIPSGSTYTTSDIKQGAHLMLIADTISNSFLSAMSTGGLGGASSSAGGMSGQAFIYCNTITNEDTTGVIVA